MAATWRPDIWFGIALNADPNDPLAYPVWRDWTAKLRRAENYERGSTFELDQALSAAPRLELLDPDETLNPLNAASAEYGLVRPYRATKMVAQWPNPAVAGQVNLFNTGNWRGNKESAHDGSFESFTAGGAKPSWIAAVGAASNFVIDAGAPFHGSRDLAYLVPGTTTPSGAAWPVQCLPGCQYTVSAYVNQTTASTQRIAVTDQVSAYETFTATAASSWGTAYLGGAWTRVQGDAVDFSKGVPGFGGDGRGLMATAVANVARMQTLAAGMADGRVWGEFSFGTAPSSTGNIIGVLARCADVNNWYLGAAVQNADGSMSAFIQKRVAGVLTTLVNAVIPGLFWAVGERYRVALDLEGAALALRVWRPAVSAGPPATATASTTDASLSAAGPAGCFGMGTTTLPVVTWTAFGVQAVAAGTSTAATGAWTRLSATFTATRPEHTIRVATEGTALAGTVMLDAIQHEQAAAASTYGTAGPSIYPLFTGNLEQVPLLWEAGGFGGVRTPPNVDAAASLSAIAINSELVQAILVTAPDFYWKLNDGGSTLDFPDSSGSGASPLVRLVSKFGAGTDLDTGQALAVPGDPGCTGVVFTATNSGGLGNRPGTALTLADPTAFPPALAAGLAGQWGITFSCWVQLTTNPTGDAHTLIDVSSGPMFLSPAPLPLCIRVTTTGVDLNLGSLVFSTSAIINSGTPHHIVGQVSSASPVQLALWVDGVKQSGTIGGTFLTATPATWLVLGARNDTFPFGYAMNGTMAQAALWHRVLSDAEVSSIYTAGATGYAGETTGARTARHLALGGYTGPTRITASGGMTTMQAPSWTGQKDLLTDAQESAAAEGGKVWTAPDGALVFEGRQDRWLRLVPSWTFGEDTGAGETPYLMDSLKINFDALYVYADVRVGRINGAAAIGGVRQDIAIAARRYFPRAAGGEFDLATDALAQSMAHWIFNTHDAPMLRAEAIEIDPVSYPALWPIVLNLEIGTRVRFVRRAKAANAGAGITMTIDYFVERVGWSVIDPERGVWRYKIQLSTPMVAGAAPGAPAFQPWILGDATYGVLNQTTVLGW